MKKAKSFLEFYGEHNISPVRQDLSDYLKHRLRRECLYRHLGLLPSYFTGKKILEFGPGGGFNSLIIADFGPRQYTLVEGNPQGVREIKANFKKHPLLNFGRFKVVHSKVEDYSTKELFDIAICECMVPHSKNQAVILNKLDSLLLPKGVMIVTCEDEISSFYEFIKRYFAFQLVKDVVGFENKVSILVEAFERHKKTLLGSSRYTRDWVIDTFLNEAVFNPLFSIKDCLASLGKKYLVYHTSPMIFTDYRWYKSIPEDRKSFNNYVIEEFDTIRHNLFFTNKNFNKRTKIKNDKLSKLCWQARRLIYLNEMKGLDVKKSMLEVISGLISNLKDTDNDVLGSLRDIRELLKMKIQVKDISQKYPLFIKAFGKVSQYISLIKNHE